MDVLGKIKELAKQRNISLAELERRTGLSSGSITKWGKSAPTVDKSVMSYNGKEVSENDRQVLERIAKAYLDGKI